MTHFNAGRKQSAEHVAKRTAATAAAYAAWPAERRLLWRQRISANNKAGSPDVRARNAAGHAGKATWNKGNNWTKDRPIDEVRATWAARERARRAANPQLRLHQSVSAQVRQAIQSRKAGRRWESLVGYTVRDLTAHLESAFSPGMSWSNYGRWHVDHVIPRARFNFTRPEDPAFKACWALSNLSPLWALDNLKKGIS